MRGPSACRSRLAIVNRRAARKPKPSGLGCEPERCNFVRKVIIPVGLVPGTLAYPRTALPQRPVPDRVALYALGAASTLCQDLPVHMLAPHHLDTPVLVILATLTAWRNLPQDHAGFAAGFWQVYNGAGNEYSLLCHASGIRRSPVQGPRTRKGSSTLPPTLVEPTGWVLFCRPAVVRPGLSDLFGG